jgi:ring-1,2-phenylacetyl-CoA epoxidase subunit PaaD
VSAGVATGTARALAGQVADPEIPVLTIEDLGILRDVAVDDDGNVEVTVTPTYTGCPAMDVIRDEVTRTLREHGYGEVRVRTVLAPAWTTDWLSAEGRAKLAAYGIAPPGQPGRAGPVLVQLTTGPREPVACPRCGSADTREVSRFGSTACMSHHTCRACLEPFDHFKTL